MADFKLWQYNPGLDNLLPVQPADGDTITNNSGGLIQLTYASLDVTGDVHKLQPTSPNNLPLLSPGQSHTFEWAVDGPGFGIYGGLFTIDANINNAVPKLLATDATALAIQSPTPGTKNNQVYNSSTPISLKISPLTFTPNDDGSKDSLVINVTKPSYYSIKVRIFSDRGIEIKTIESGNNRVVWDGRDNNGLPARRGGYIVIVEFNSQFGESKILRKGVALWR